MALTEKPTCTIRDRQIRCSHQHRPCPFHPPLNRHIPMMQKIPIARLNKLAKRWADTDNACQFSQAINSIQVSLNIVDVYVIAYELYSGMEYRVAE